MAEARLVAKAIWKGYGGAPVLRGVDLAVGAGEVHALLGANGAGKSTLIGCLAGDHRPDAGTIAIDRASYESFNPAAAARAGTVAVRQRFGAIADLTVAENVFLGAELRRHGPIRRRAQEAEVARLLALLGHDGLSPKARVGDLSLAELQLVEILKALRTAPKVLILDEPTSALGASDASALIERVRTLAGSGIAVLYSTHLLQEVFELADTVTVLRGGVVALHAATADLSLDELVAAINPVAANEDAAPRPLARRDATQTVARLRSYALPGVGPVDVDLEAGEIVGIFGPLGAGQTELLETVAGGRRATHGSLEVDGRPVPPGSVRAALRCGVAYVPSDRQRQSILSDLTAGENVLLPQFAALARGGFRRRATERRLFDDVAEDLDVRPPSMQAPAWTLSGGNQQKLVLGRWLNTARTPRLLVMDGPTQGVDVGGRRQLYARLASFADAGGSVLFSSTEPEEIAAIAGRAIVLNQGMVVGEWTAGFDDVDRLMTLAHA